MSPKASKMSSTSWNWCAELVGAGVAELVVAGPLLAVGEDLVGLGRLLELLDGLGVAGVAVGVVLDRQLAIRRRDLLVGSVALHAQDFVVIAFGGHRWHGRWQRQCNQGSRLGEIYHAAWFIVGGKALASR